VPEQRKPPGRSLRCSANCIRLPRARQKAHNRGLPDFRVDTCKQFRSHRWFPIRRASAGRHAPFGKAVFAARTVSGGIEGILLLWRLIDVLPFLTSRYLRDMENIFLPLSWRFFPLFPLILSPLFEFANSIELTLNSSKREKTLFEHAHYFLHECTEPWSNHNFRMVFLARVSLILGLTLFMTFIEYYFARVQHIANFVLVTGIIAMLALGGAIVSGLISGILSDRFKRRASVVCVATLCMSLAPLAFVIFPNTLANWLWLLGILFGLGYGAYTSVN
jgi:Na+/melibiose symporter-like transporter